MPTSIQKKKCSKCKQERPIVDFGKRSSSPDGLFYECKFCKRYRNRKHYKNNKEAILERTQEYRKQNKAKIKEYMDLYYSKEENKEKRKDPAWKLANNFRRYFLLGLKNQNAPKTNSFWKIVTYTPQELKEHLESQFEPWMTWSNHGRWHVDHIIPQSSFDFSNEEEIKKCWSLENLRPLEAKENIRKSNNQVDIL